MGRYSCSGGDGCGSKSVHEQYNRRANFCPRRLLQPFQCPVVLTIPYKTTYRGDASGAKGGVEVCGNVEVGEACSAFKLASTGACGAVVAFSGFAVTAVIAANCGMGVPSFTTLKAKG